MAAVPFALLALSGCGGGKTVAVCEQGRKVPLKVIKGSGGATMAPVPVRIDGHGPFVFTLDTGASTSAINTALAWRLGLRSVGKAGPVQGIAGKERATIVALRSWKAGSVPLAPTRIAALNLFPDTPRGPQGLLGSDALSAFTSVCVDYRSQVLRVGAR